MIFKYYCITTNATDGVGKYIAFSFLLLFLWIAVVVVTRPLPRDEDMAKVHGAPEAGNSPGSGPEVVERQRVARE